MDAIKLLKDYHKDKMPTIKEIEHTYILHVLEIKNGSACDAAKILGISRATIYRRLKEYRKMVKS